MIPDAGEDVRPRILAEGLLFPEGPVALPDGTIAVAELAGGRVSVVNPAGRVSELARPGGGPNGLAPGPDGALYLCNSGGLEFQRRADGRLRPLPIARDDGGGRIERIDPTGRVDLLYRSCAGTALNAPNDIVFDADGGFWFTDHGHQRGRQLDLGAVYYARADGSHITEAAFGLLTPNGIGLSPDGTLLYVSETLSGRVRRYAVQGPGRLAPLPWGGEIAPANSLVARPVYDSMAIEADGAVAIATLGSGGITIIAADGHFVEFVPTGDAFTTNICFAGADRCDAFITLSSRGLLAQCRWARPGLPLNGAVPG